MRKAIALGLALVALAAACGGDDAEEAAEDATTALTDTGITETDDLDTATDGLDAAVMVDLQEQNDSGITGEAEISPTSEGGVEVEIEVDGSSGGPHPAHIHEGTCDDLNPTPAFPLTDVVDGESRTTLEVDVAELSATEYAINVHESAENAGVYVACGDIGDAGIG